MAGILNALTDATAGLATIQSLGNNASLGAPGISIAGVGIPGIPLISYRDYFLTSMESWIAAIPTRTQFIAIIDQIPAGLTTNLLQKLEKNDRLTDKDFDINAAKKALGNHLLQNVMGCIFLAGASIPSESLAASNAQIENNAGFKQGSILQGRDAFASNNLTLQFRETNASFTDLVMRPWLIAASHAGFVARPKTDPLYTKCNITILQYTRTYQKVSMIPRKVWNFYDCVPLNLSVRNLSYDAEDVENYDVSFIYDDYAVQDTLYLPLPDIISSIAHGNIPRISPFQK